jgi:hypothetical protein
MKYLEWIPSLIKKVIGYSCSLFLLGWGAYDKFESRLNANNEKVIGTVRIERQLELGAIHAEIGLIKNDMGWVRSSLESSHGKLDVLLRSAK